MTLKEFESEKERSIVRNHVIYTFYQLSDVDYLIEVALRGRVTDYSLMLREWHKATIMVTSIEAAEVYNELLNNTEEA